MWMEKETYTTLISKKSMGENKMICYKTVETSGFQDLKDLTSHFSIKKIPCRNSLSVDYNRVCWHYRCFRGSEQDGPGLDK